MGSPAVTAACFDSDVLIDFMQGYQLAVNELARWREQHISVVSWIELMTGAARRGIEAEVRPFLGRLRIHDLTLPIADEAYALRAQHRLRTPDASIWATARTHGLVLVTRNTRDFPANDPTIRVPYQL